MTDSKTFSNRRENEHRVSVWFLGSTVSKSSKNMVTFKQVPTEWNKAKWGDKNKLDSIWQW